MKKTFFTLLAFSAVFACATVMPDKFGAQKLSSYVDNFNANDNELYPDTYPNSTAKEFLSQNIPLFDCPDSDIERTYYFRWWTYRKHVKKLDNGKFIVTEFQPKVGWADKNNAIVCPVGHQIREGRWLKNSSVVSDYIKYWCFDSYKYLHRYSSWLADSALNFHRVRPDVKLLEEIYPVLKKNVEKREKENRKPNETLFFIVDSRDGMEISISGAFNCRWTGYRATINSYMAADYAAIAKIAKILGNAEDEKIYSQKAKIQRDALNKKLWDSEGKFYKVMPANEGENGPLSPVRELHGFTPWYFGIAPEEYSDAWKQAVDEKGFKAPYGFTSAERRSPLFQISYIGHECQWNGPVWPFSTSITLTGMANLLNDYSNRPISKDDYFDALKTYAKSQQLTRADGSKVPWIDECQNPFNGDWITRTRLLNWKNTNSIVIKERGKDYNHSTFADLVIEGLVGLRARDGGTVVVNPLVPDSWKYFCLDGVQCKGHELSIVWDKDGTRYGKGKGFSIFSDGKPVFNSTKIERTTIEL